MNITLTVVVVVLVWSLVSIVVALVVGAIAKVRDDGAQRTTPLRDERIRPAV